jgi:hypothetical protein
MKNKTKANTYLLIFLSPFLLLILFMMGSTIMGIVNNMETFLWFVFISSIITLWAWTLKLFVKYSEMAESEAENKNPIVST